MQGERVERPVDLPVEDTADVQTLGRGGVHGEVCGRECHTILFVGAVLTVEDVVAHLGSVRDALAVRLVWLAREHLCAARSRATYKAKNKEDLEKGSFTAWFTGNNKI